MKTSSLIKVGFWGVFFLLEMGCLVWLGIEIRHAVEEMGTSLRERENALYLKPRHESQILVLHRFDPLSQVFFKGKADALLKLRAQEEASSKEESQSRKLSGFFKKQEKKPW